MQLEGHVLITGGAGFLGRAIMRRAAQDGWNCDFTIYSRDELKQSLCRRKYPMARYVLGDIRDEDRLQLAMLHCDTVIHTAALKYVPEAEANVSECISTNVGGTQAVLNCAYHADVPKTIVISTDKAVQPTNVYGMTKALCERLVDEHSNHMSCYAVRYGNVIGSTGSVIPEFMRRAAAGEALRLTDPTMTRFWMPADDAIDLILFALHNGTIGSTLVKVARSMTLHDLAKAISVDATLEIIGARPGERHHETLLTDYEASVAWNHGDYYELPAQVRRRATQVVQFHGIHSSTVDYLHEREMQQYITDAAGI